MRPYAVLFLKAILAVSIASILTIFVGRDKNMREENAALRAKIASISAMIPVSPPEGSVSDAVPAGDPYLLAAEVLSVEELPQRSVHDSFRYLVIEVAVPGEGDSRKHISFRMKGGLVADFLKRSIGCAVFR